MQSNDLCLLHTWHTSARFSHQPPWFWDHQSLEPHASSWLSPCGASCVGTCWRSLGSQHSQQCELCSWGTLGHGQNDRQPQLKHGPFLPLKLFLPMFWKFCMRAITSALEPGLRVGCMVHCGGPKGWRTQHQSHLESWLLANGCG